MLEYELPGSGLPFWSLVMKSPAVMIGTWY